MSTDKFQNREKIRQLMSRKIDGEAQSDTAVFFDSMSRYCAKINRFSNHLARRRHNQPRYSEQMQAKMTELKRKVFVCGSSPVPE